MQTIRRDLIRKVIALDPVIDEAIGESSDLRYRFPVLQAAADGLFAALAGWRTVATRLARLPDEAARQEAGEVLRELPRELWSTPARGEPARWLAEPIRMRDLSDASLHALAAMPARTPALKLLADQSSAVMSGISDALDGLALLVADPTRRWSRPRHFRLYVPDWLPAFVNAGRTFAVIAAVEIFWIMTEWPNGATAITFTAISVIIFAPRADAAYALHGGRRPCRRLRGDPCICRLAERRDLRRLQHLAGLLFGTDGRPDGSTMAGADVCRHGRQLHTGARTHEPDEL
jgi:hypothetical protein